MLYSIPAHKSLISQVKFEPQEGYYLATSSYDTKAAVSFICHLFSFISSVTTQLISHIFHIFSCGQLGISNQSKVWWAMSRRLLVWILVEVYKIFAYAFLYRCCAVSIQNSFLGVTILSGFIGNGVKLFLNFLTSSEIS